LYDFFLKTFLFMNLFYRFLSIFFVCTALCYGSEEGLPPVFGIEFKDGVFDGSRVVKYIAPRRVVWQNDCDGRLIKDSGALTEGANNGQAALGGVRVCTMTATDSCRAAVLLDFGVEIQGGLQVVTGGGGQHSKTRLTVRFGESVTEAMTPLGERGAQTDHAVKEMLMEVPWMGAAEVGDSGFRFVYVEVADAGVTVELKEINAVFKYRDVPYKGSFRSSDSRLDSIWMTGAYTVHLNMQEYLWDGVKRDRLVWVGDLHPEVMTVSSVFGYNDVVPKSLDLARDLTPLPGYMNGMSAYSLWWIIIQKDWYLYQGDRDYLNGQREYLTGLLKVVFGKIDGNGNETFSGRFLDWPSSTNEQGVKAGMKALTVMALQAGAELCDALGEGRIAGECREKVAMMRRSAPDCNGLKQAAALLALSGMVDAGDANRDVISVGGAAGFSTFYGYYMLEAQAAAGDYGGALDNIRRFWGGMLDHGATSFWEDFDLEWTVNSGRIDGFTPEGMRDIHADFGDYCYRGLRHSLCHGWASGPTAWLTAYVLGVKPLSPGCDRLLVRPHLCDLDWVEGSFPTPRGVVYVSHRKGANGKVVTKVKAPRGVKIVR
jgi:hypothetical protein